MRMTLASSVARISSSKDWRACEISGLMEAKGWGGMLDTAAAKEVILCKSRKSLVDILRSFAVLEVDF